MWILVILVAAASAQSQCNNQFSSGCCSCLGNTQGTCTNPCTQFCGCVCKTGFTGDTGGHSCDLGSSTSIACGSSGNTPGTNNYQLTNQGCVCGTRCGFTARTTLCSSRGVLPSDYELNDVHNSGFNFLEMDCFVGAGVGCVQNYAAQQSYTSVYGTATVGFCRCDPGYYGAAASPFFTACGSSISASYCQLNGHDNTGFPAGVGGCPSSPPFTGFTSCGQRYVSSLTPGTGFLCRCNAGWIGGTGPTDQTQCASTIRALTCSGHGQDACNNCTYVSTSKFAPQCLCDLGWGPGFTSGQAQCTTFISCATYGCGTPRSPVQGYTPTFGGTCTSVNATVCNCNAGYGGIACCPFQFGSSSVFCNAQGPCTSSGTCSCNQGFQLPGCCSGCDASQQCLPDGRCDCPTLGALKCGSFGVSCSNTTVRVCTFRNATVTPRAGVSFSVPMAGQFGCPLGDCAGHGTCTSLSAVLDTTSNSVTGSCTCSQDLAAPYNRIGSFCCPIYPGQTAPCSGGVQGYCNPLTATCICDPGVLGLACETNTNCNPKASPPSQCNGNGQCSQNVAGDGGLGDYLTQLLFTTCSSPYISSDGLQFSNCGAILFLQRAYAGFFGINTLAPPAGLSESAFYNHPYPTCTAASSQSLCFMAMLVSMQTLPNGAPTANTICGQINAFGGSAGYVLQAFARLHPTRSLFSGAYDNQLTTSFTCSATQQTIADAMASMLGWELWNQLYRSDVSTPPDSRLFTIIPSLPAVLQPSGPFTQWECECPAGVGGSQCQQTGCPIGTNGQTCSGFTNGVFQGACNGLGSCECSAAFGGTACQISKSPACFPTGDSGVTLCSNNGQCVLINGTAFTCQCQAQFTGNYCQLSRCQPPGKRLSPHNELVLHFFQ